MFTVHCANIPLAKTCVIDVGFIANCGWALIEANAVWGAGLNGCEAEKILPAIEAATGWEDNKCEARK